MLACYGPSGYNFSLVGIDTWSLLAIETKTNKSFQLCLTEAQKGEPRPLFHQLPCRPGHQRLRFLRSPFDFDGVVTESGTNDSFALSVECEMVYATSDVGQWNFLNQQQGRPFRRAGRVL
ncbi:MAG: hypothetical protein JWO91_2382 [Acidobacteriaceae bacterium]|jgi:hypothetical protein|nr:hypothetical protein [Acidobacteriaceae bacterium]